MFEPEENDPEKEIKLAHPKVANVRIAFKNGEMIELLKERGRLVGEDRPIEDIANINNNIEKLKEETQDLEPVCAFITFVC